MDKVLAQLLWSTIRNISWNEDNLFGLLDIKVHCADLRVNWIHSHVIVADPHYAHLFLGPLLVLSTLVQVDIVVKGEVTHYVGLLCVPHNCVFPSKRKLLVVALSCKIVIEEKGYQRPSTSS